MIGTLPPPIHGAAVMTKMIKDSALINESVDMDWVNLSTSRSLKEIGKSGFLKYFRQLKSLVRLIYLLCVNHYELAYITLTCHGSGFLKDAPFAILCKLRGLRLIIHQHNKGMKRNVESKLFRPLLKTVYRNSVVVLLSERLYPDIESIVSHHQIRIIPNGIREANSSIPRYRESSIPRLLFLSNLIPSKGVHVLLQALRILKDRELEFECEFIGEETRDITKDNLIEYIQKLDLVSEVAYVGKKFGERKEEELRQGDIFVFPTFYDNEAFPLVILEAMQFGLPVVTTSEGGISDIVKDGETGFICKSQDPVDLADKLQQLIENPMLRSEMGKEGKKRYMENFTVSDFEERMLKLFLEESKK